MKPQLERILESRVPTLALKLEHGNLASCLGTWRSSCAKGIDILNRRMVKLESIDPGECPNLCLVEVHDAHSVSVGFHYWSRVPMKFGWAHKVPICRKTRRVGYVPVNNSLGECQIDLRSMLVSRTATMVHADTGVTMVKPRAFRDTMPDELISLQRMWGVGAGGPMPQYATCLLCSVESGSDLHTCPICMLTMHSDCAVSNALSWSISGVGETTPGSIPVGWKLCPFCALAARHDRVLWL